MGAWPPRAKVRKFFRIDRAQWRKVLIQTKIRAGMDLPANRTMYAALRSKQSRFLACVAVCGSITLACRWAKLTRQAHYNWLDSEPDYKPKFEAALRRSASVLADEAIRRGHDGVRKPVYYRGKVVGYETVYSDGLLLRMLEARDPQYSSRQKLEHTGKDGAPLHTLEDLRAYMKQAPEDGEA